MFSVGDRVQLIAAMRAYGLAEGDTGTVVGAHRDHRTYIVAFDRGGEPVGQYDVPYSQLRRLSPTPHSDNQQ
ncbi:MAG: DUF4926 domain-containing protein [Chloroflexota bacterium]|nr:DUF4926 domain-containing protein [Chloroflexota bacterium]